MMAQVEPFLDFRDEYMLEQYDETVEHYEKTDQKTRPWSFGALSVDIFPRADTKPHKVRSTDP